MWKELNYSLMVSSYENRELLQANDQCDKYDYLAAVACGAIGGLIDIFLLGAPGDIMCYGWYRCRATLWRSLSDILYEAKSYSMV